jgi:hypothetical protein
MLAFAIFIEFMCRKSSYKVNKLVNLALAIATIHSGPAFYDRNDGMMGDISELRIIKLP